MNKKNIQVVKFLFAISMVFVFSSLLIYLFLLFKIQKEKPTDIVVTNIGTTEATIYWKNNEGVYSILYYKEKDKNIPYIPVVGSSLYKNIKEENYFYEASLSKLQPETTYTFRIQSPKQKWDYDLEFTTEEFGTKVELPEIKTGDTDRGNFLLIESEGKKNMVYTSYHGTWAMDLKGKNYTVTEYAQFIPSEILVQELKSSLLNISSPVYAESGPNCKTNITVTDTQYLPTSKQIQRVIDIGYFNCKGDHSEECYNDVYCQAIEAGVNPALPLTLWFAESGVSMYARWPDVEDFGIHGGGVPSRDFSKQLERFLEVQMSDDYISGYCTDKGLTEEERWATKYSKGYCTDENIAGGKAYITKIRTYYNLLTNGTLPSWPWNVTPSSSVCNRSKQVTNGVLRDCNGNSSGTNPGTEPGGNCSGTDNTPGKTDITLGETCDDVGGCECFKGTIKTENYLKDVKCGSLCSEENTNPNLPSTTEPKDGVRDEMIVSTKNRECVDPDGCVCLYDPDGNNYNTRMNADFGYTCTPDKKIIKTPTPSVCGNKKKEGSEACDPPNSTCTAASGKQSKCSSTCTCPEPTTPEKTILEVTDKDLYCRDTQGCICYWNNKSVKKEAENGYTCTTDQKVIKTENKCCYYNNSLTMKMPYDCTGTIRSEISKENCRIETTDYIIRKGISFISPLEVVDIDDPLTPKSAYDLINISDKRVIAVGEYQSGKWVHVVKFEEGEIKGNNFPLKSGFSYMISSLHDTKFKIKGYRLNPPDVLKSLGWTLVPSSVFASKGKTSFDILENLEFNQIKQIGQWQVEKGLFQYTIKDSNNNIFGDDLNIKDEEGIFVKVIEKTNL